jgi:hypothetical protein
MYGIKETDTLNAAAAREHDDERNICPPAWHHQSVYPSVE